MNSIYRYLVQPVNLNRFSWPISGYPSPSVKPQDPPAPPLEAAQESTSGNSDDPGTTSISPIGGNELSIAHETTPTPVFSTAMLLVLAIILSFILGFMSQRLLMHPEDFVSINHPDLKLDDLRRLWQINVLGRHFILGMAV